MNTNKISENFHKNDCSFKTGSVTLYYEKMFDLFSQVKKNIYKTKN